MSGLSMLNRSGLVSLMLVAGISIALPAEAEVPVNDASRTATETNTAACMQRARTYKQSTVVPSRGVTTSFSTQGDLAGVGQVSGASVSGAPLSGTTIGNNDLAILLAVGQGVAALKTKNAGQVVNALAAVAAAIKANSTSLTGLEQKIGTANSLQGAFDQNSALRLSGAQIWNQAIGAVNTTVQMRNQRLIDAAAAESAATRVMTYDPAKASFVNDNRSSGGN